MDQQKAFGRITKRVPIEGSILTYRLAARELGCSVKQAKATLQAYFESDVAKERGVGAVWLISGHLARDAASAPSTATASASTQDGMDVDPPKGTNPDDGDKDEVVQVKTVRLVQDKDLAAQRALFAALPHPPTTHLYALLPSSSLPSLALLGPAALSLAPASAREKWRPAPEDAPAYGAVTHPDGERKREKGKGKAPMPKAGSSKSATTAAAPAPVVKKESKKEDKPLKGNAGKKDKAGAAGKKDDAGPKARPIGQLGGLFSRAFDEPKKDKKKKGKGKASPSPSPSPSASDEEEEDVKPKMVVPAKRKSTSPVAARKKAPSPVKKRPSVPDVVLDADDDDDDWAMDEEALLEAERAAEQQAAAKKAGGAAPGAGTGATAGGGAKKGETKAERQKRELEEMMKSDVTMDVDEKPARAPPSRTSSSSSVAASSNKPKAKNGSGGGAAQQKGLNAFFKKK